MATLSTSTAASIEEFRARARACADSGRWDEAEAALGGLLRQSPEDVEALNVLSASATARGAFHEAGAMLHQALAVAPGDGSVRKNLGMLLLQTGDAAGAADVLQQAVDDDPDFFVARLLLGLAHERCGQPEIAYAGYLAALTRAHAHGLWMDPARTPPGLRPLVAHARQSVRGYRLQVIDRVLSPLRERHGEQSLARVRRCFANFLGDEGSRPASRDQRPLFLYFPGLPETPYFDRALFPWYEALEDAWTGIRDEMEQALEQDMGMVPFLGTPPTDAGTGPSYLAGHGDAAARWDGLFFHRHGKRYAENCDRCPATEAALDAVPLVHIRNQSPETLFSVLGPGSHILPHTGVTNTRTVTHMPLVVPRDCALSVAGEQHAWQPGRCVSFDDTFEHEAWNRSNEVRVVLLFDVWNPHLEPVEREAIAEFVATIGDARAMAPH